MEELKNRRSWFMGLCAAAVLAAVITGGAVWAQDEDTEPEQNTGRQGMASRVAEILSLEKEEVEAAFQQASQEMRDDRFQSRTDRLVEKGELTEEEAAEAIEWYQSRPEGIGRGHRGYGRGSVSKGSGDHRPGARFGGFGTRGMERFAHTGF